MKTPDADSANKPRTTPAGVCALSRTSEEFVDACKAAGLSARPFALKAYKAVFRDGAMNDPLARVVLPPVETVLREQSPEGEVIKFLLRLDSVAPATDAAGSAAASKVPEPLKGSSLTIESVLIPMIGSLGQPTYTLCVSSQVGCAMGCNFCETAQMGLIRSLTAAEIVAQWYTARHIIGVAPKNIVFMGMGEPMDNFENVMQAVAILKDHNGAHIPASQVTISTVGRVDGIRKMAEAIKQEGWHRLNLALSLNASNDAVRGELMPINRKWNMAEVQQALLDWPRFAGNKICVEYVLIPGVNDAEEHVREIAAFMEPFKVSNGGKPRAMLNLIPYNPRRNSPWPAPEESRVDWFLKALIAAGVFAKRRRTKGRTMMGACGQLGAAHIRQRRLVQPTVSM